MSGLSSIKGGQKKVKGIQRSKKKQGKDMEEHDFVKDLKEGTKKRKSIITLKNILKHDVSWKDVQKTKKGTTKHGQKMQKGAKKMVSKKGKDTGEYHLSGKDLQKTKKGTMKHGQKMQKGAKKMVSRKGKDAGEYHLSGKDLQKTKKGTTKRTQKMQKGAKKIVNKKGKDTGKYHLSGKDVQKTKKGTTKRGSRKGKDSGEHHVSVKDMQKTKKKIKKTRSIKRKNIKEDDIAGTDGKKSEKGTVILISKKEGSKSIWSCDTRAKGQKRKDIEEHNLQVKSKKAKTGQDESPSVAQKMSEHATPGVKCITATVVSHIPGVAKNQGPQLAKQLSGVQAAGAAKTGQTAKTFAESARAYSVLARRLTQLSQSTSSQKKAPKKRKSEASQVVEYWQRVRIQGTVNGQTASELKNDVGKKAENKDQGAKKGFLVIEPSAKGQGPQVAKQVQGEEPAVGAVQYDQIAPVIGKRGSASITRWSAQLSQSKSADSAKEISSTTDSHDKQVSSLASDKSVTKTTSVEKENSQTGNYRKETISRTNDVKQVPSTSETSVKKAWTHKSGAREKKRTKAKSSASGKHVKKVKSSTSGKHAKKFSSSKNESKKHKRADGSPGVRPAKRKKKRKEGKAEPLKISIGLLTPGINRQPSKIEKRSQRVPGVQQKAVDPPFMAMNPSAAKKKATQMQCTAPITKNEGPVKMAYVLSKRLQQMLPRDLQTKLKDQLQATLTPVCRVLPGVKDAAPNCVSLITPVGGKETHSLNLSSSANSTSVDKEDTLLASNSLSTSTSRDVGQASKDLMAVAQLMGTTQDASTASSIVSQGEASLSVKATSLVNGNTYSGYSRINSLESHCVLCEREVQSGETGYGQNEFLTLKVLEDSHAMRGYLTLGELFEKHLSVPKVRSMVFCNGCYCGLSKVYSESFLLADACENLHLLVKKGGSRLGRDLSELLEMARNPSAEKKRQDQSTVTVRNALPPVSKISLVNVPSQPGSRESSVTVLVECNTPGYFSCRVIERVATCSLCDTKFQQEDKHFRFCSLPGEEQVLVMDILQKIGVQTTKHQWATCAVCLFCRNAVYRVFMNLKLLSQSKADFCSSLPGKDVIRNWFIRKMKTYAPPILHSLIHIHTHDESKGLTEKIECNTSQKPAESKKKHCSVCNNQPRYDCRMLSQCEGDIANGKQGKFLDLLHVLREFRINISSQEATAGIVCRWCELSLEGMVLSSDNLSQTLSRLKHRLQKSRLPLEDVCKIFEVVGLPSSGSADWNQHCVAQKVPPTTSHASAEKNQSECANERDPESDTGSEGWIDLENLEELEDLKDPGADSASVVERGHEGNTSDGQRDHEGHTVTESQLVIDDQLGESQLEDQGQTCLSHTGENHICSVCTHSLTKNESSQTGHRSACIQDLFKSLGYLTISREEQQEIEAMCSACFSTLDNLRLHLGSMSSNMRHLLLVASKHQEVGRQLCRKLDQVLGYILGTERWSTMQQQKTGVFPGEPESTSVPDATQPATASQIKH